ncbi:MAG: lytic transglycosylase domain-containing protein [Pseudolabrys sp.]
MQTPQAAIAASARLLRNLVRQFGNLGLAAAAYNAGPRRIQDWLARKGKLPEETQHYVKTITGRPAENWKAAKAASSVQNVPRQAPCQEATGLIASNEPQPVRVRCCPTSKLLPIGAPGVRAVPPS